MGRTKKLGSAARFGTRYGRRVKQRIIRMEAVKRHKCPNCLKMGIKRESAGIWKCPKCGLKMAGKAYKPE